MPSPSSPPTRYGRGFTQQTAANTTVRFTIVSAHPRVPNVTVDQPLVSLAVRHRDPNSRLCPLLATRHPNSRLPRQSGSCLLMWADARSNMPYWQDSTVLTCSLPSYAIPVWSEQLEMQVPVPMHSISGQVHISVSLDGGDHFTSQGAFMTLDCASPPPPLPPPPPPASPDEPRVCWAWGDPHIIPFDGAQYDAHGLGVRTLAAWDADQSVQIYSCPVRCEAGTAEWFPCGASSAVAISASIAGMAVSLVGDTVYVAGSILSPPLSAAGESRTVSCPLCPSNGLLTIRRLADDDPDYKTPGAKIQLTFGEGAAGGDARALKLWTR